MEKLAAAGQRFAEAMPPVEALRAWLLLFVEGIATVWALSAYLRGAGVL